MIKISQIVYRLLDCTCIITGSCQTVDPILAIALLTGEDLSRNVIHTASTCNNLQRIVCKLVPFRIFHNYTSCNSLVPKSEDPDFPGLSPLCIDYIIPDNS